MSKRCYYFEAGHITYDYLEVEADSLDEAIAKAKKMSNDWESDGNGSELASMSYTVRDYADDEDDWEDIETGEEFTREKWFLYR